MKIGIVLPHHEIGADPGAIKAFATGAEELGADHIRVNTVVPTWMWGEPVESFVNMQAESLGVSTEEVIAGITSKMAIPEIPEDGDVAEAAIFFCSDRARFITGQYLMVNSGEFMP